MSTIDHYQELLAIDPCSKVFILLAEALCAQGQWEAAVSVCRKGLVHHPESLRGAALLGWALWESGAIEDAEAVLTRVAAQIAGCAHVYRILSQTAASRGDLAEAQRMERIHSHLRPSGERIPSATETEASITPEPLAPLPFLQDLLDALSERDASKTDPWPLFNPQDRSLLRRVLMGVETPGT